MSQNINSPQTPEALKTDNFTIESDGNGFYYLVATGTRSQNFIENLEFTDFSKLVDKEFRITYEGNGSSLESLKIVNIEPLQNN